MALIDHLCAESFALLSRTGFNRHARVADQVRGAGQARRRPLPTPLGNHPAMATTRSTERRRTLVVNPRTQRRIVYAFSLVPTLGLTLCCVIVAIFARKVLGEAVRADAELPSLVPLFLSLLGFVVVSAIVVLVQALRFSHRVAGPTYRLCKSLQRIRTGDVSFRVHLRAGDHLEEIAVEVNHLLEWLNANPPAGVRTGSDVVTLDADVDHDLESVCTTPVRDPEP